ncbi:16S rRNA (guanine(527)-N(7))-methyltransferase RsmG [Cohnella candidum]|uniref:Ribosomal RNA small subunit methyltransferase G n=1 Tax=Cohnella candidum TaxID=2674991 RepID=A0A3G3K270_9BACL|nr:16S rRNA (guanine(527)-N(7))-methyltransferase RsmG [Cohnella candidum]AYQ74568.1 16S rRNA (guanine(527)-N(7))-methyltransferase RsmG [Cohnella candidum]
MDSVQRVFVERLSELGIHLSEPDKQLEQFETYYRLLVEWNEKMNLTGITEREAVYEKHFYDSLTLAGVTDLRETASIADIGSGAGFPSLPIKIAFPHLKVTIVDALAKRIRFLEEVVSGLGLKDVVCLHGRAEEVSRKPEHRDAYDLVTARAVARLAALNELCMPFAKTGGKFIAMKGSDVTEELDEALYSVKQLNGAFRNTVQLTLPSEGSARHLIVIAKTGSTPKAYPRKPGLPLKQPLVNGAAKVK